MEWNQLLASVQRPGRYLSNEINAVHKDKAGIRLRFALAFPDTYEIGMSHMGIQILYHILNQRAEVFCERVFAPWVDMEAAMRRNGIPLGSQETRTPLWEFDIVGFSLQYELSYTNVLNMLELGGIPLLAAHRKNSHPVVIAGGPCCTNPEPLADFLDAVVIGDGEDIVLELVDHVLAWKEEGSDRSSLLNRLAAIPGVYVPSLYDVEYDHAGRVIKWSPSPGAPQHVYRRLVPRLKFEDYPVAPVVPFMRVVHDRLNLEIARGCTRGCRFCQAGMINRPLREKDPQELLEMARLALNRTGYDEMALLSLSSGDYSCLESLMTDLMDHYARERVAISMPSLRVKGLSTSLMQQIKRVRKTGFTLAPEAGHPRLRRIINKPIEEDDLIVTARSAYGLGWNLLKLYFMIGLPKETEEDLEAIIHLSRRVQNCGKGKRLNVSISNFVPKPHTPFQWVSQIPADEIRRRQRFLMDQLKGRNLQVKWQASDVSVLEGIFSRGDRRLSPVLIAAHQLGCRFDGWSDQFRADIWEQVFKEKGLSPEIYLRERGLDEALPWGFINCGVKADYLKSELQRAHQEVVTPDCRWDGCRKCGACDGQDITNVTFDHLNEARPRSIMPGMGRDLLVAKQCRYRCRYERVEQGALLGHLELMQTFIRAFRRAHIRMEYSRGFHPHPKISFGPALPIGVSSRMELFDVYLVSPMDPRKLQQRLNVALPQGLRILDIIEIPLNIDPLSVMIEKNRFRVNGVSLQTTCGLGPEEIKQKIKTFLEKESFLVIRRGKKGPRSMDIQPAVEEIRVDEIGDLEMLLRCGEGGLGPVEAASFVLEVKEKDVRRLPIVKIGFAFRGGKEERCPAS